LSPLPPTRRARAAVFLAAVLGAGNAFGAAIGQPLAQYSPAQSDAILAGPIFGLATGAYGFEPARYPVALYAVSYRTTNPYLGQARESASGLIALPLGAPGPLPVLEYQHGTDFSRHSVPSHPESCLEARAVAAAFAGHGYAVFMPDYIGKGISTSPHTYMLARGEARACRDMLEAGRRFCSRRHVRLSRDIFLSGWSQGGHATMAFLRLLEREKYPGVRAAAPIAGPYDLYLTWTLWLTQPASPMAPSLLAYMISSYEHHYGLPGLLRSALKPPYQGLPENTFDTDPVPPDAVARFGRTPQDLLRADFIAAVISGSGVFSRKLRENATCLWRGATPVRFYYGEADDIVPPVVTRKAYERMKSLGAPVWLADAGRSAGHREAFLFALADARRWFDRLRSAGE